MRELFQDRINRLTAYKALHGFSLGLVSIFIPIYVAQQGFDPFSVFLFLMVDVAAFTLVAMPVGKIVSWLGIESSLLISSILYVLVFVILQAASLNYALIYSVAFLIGLAKAFHWIPVNTEFTAGSDESDRGRSYGKLEGLPKILSPLAPLIGAIVMSSLGFSFLVALSLLFAVFSVIPLTFAKDKGKPGFKTSGLLNTSNYDLWILYFLDGFATTAYVFIFPLFIYYIIGGALNVGSAKTFMAIGAGLFSIATGKISDRISHEKMLLAGSISSATVYLFIPGLQSRYWAFILSFTAGLTYTIYTVPLISIVADVAEGKNLTGFFSVREVFQGSGKITVVGLLLYMIKYDSLSAAFGYTFTIAAVAVIMIALQSRHVKAKRLQT